jgi:hypothetical protein
MPQAPILLPEADYQIMNTSYNQFFEIAQNLPPEIQYFITNATHRLAEVDWITCKLEEQIRGRGAPVVQEGILSLQLYLLLTCADNLGHIYITDGVEKRFRKFFKELPQEAKQNLIDNIFTWKTANTTSYPSCEQIRQTVQLLRFNKRLEAVVDFLFYWRNYYTHQSEHPQLGSHPNLSVMQGQRLNIPNIATLGERDRLIPMFSKSNIYFTYIETNDVIATVRWSIVRGLGKIIGCV